MKKIKKLTLFKFRVKPWVFILLSMLHFKSTYADNQIIYTCETCDDFKEEQNDDDGHGSYSRYLDGDLTHPLTTFSKDHDLSYYVGVLEFYLNDDPNLIKTNYESIFKAADKFTKSHPTLSSSATRSTLDSNGFVISNKDKNAIAAKNCAFVYMMGLDQDGSKLSSGRLKEFRNIAWRAIMLLRYSDQSKIGYGSRKTYQVGKRIIHFLQAYDYIMAVDPDEKANKDAGYLLQYYVGEFYQHHGRKIGGAMVRNDNHSLMFAGVLGMASVVLHIHSHKKTKKSFHPERWANAALWRITRTLWTEQVGKKTESREDEKYGFGEGVYYFSFSMVENVLPYMLTLKNAKAGKLYNPERSNYKYGPESWLKLLYAKEEVEVNLWDDDDYYNLFEWYSSMLRPDGYGLITDDGYTQNGSKGIAIFRKPELINCPSTALKRGNFTNSSTDVLAALIEGYFLNEPSEVNNNKTFDNGEAVIFTSMTDNAFNPLTSTVDRQFMFYLNAKTKDRMKEYHQRSSINFGPHGHDDLGNFLLFAGNADEFNSAIIPEAVARVDPAKNVYKPEYHNVLLINGNGPKKETPQLLENSLKNGTGRISYKYFYKNNIELIRTIDVFKIGSNITYELTDELIGDNLSNKEIEWRMLTNGNYDESTPANGTLLEKKENLKYFVKGPCENSSSGVPFELAVLFVEDFTTTNRTTVLEDVYIGDQGGEHGLSFNGDSFWEFKRSAIVKKVTNSSNFKLTTVLMPDFCNNLKFPYGRPEVYDGDNAAAYSQRAKKYLVSNVRADSENKYKVFNPFGNTNYSDTLFSNAKYLSFVLDTTRGDTIQCQQISVFEKLRLDSGSYVKIDSQTYFLSNHSIASLLYKYDKIYYYSGSIKNYIGDDTVTLFIPDVPSTFLSLMEEKTGINYSYDTLTSEITLIFQDTGTYNFVIGPSNPCAVSCFYPSDSIWYHFEHTFTHERLGHILDITQDSGWLDMQKGARMNICGKAVLNNLDSLTLSSSYSCYDNDAYGTEPGSYGTVGYASHYFNSEGNKYRKGYRIGSGAGIGEDGLSGDDQTAKYPSKRTMIIVEDEGALVLKSGSHTVVGNGSTILIKPGGSLKIEDGASLIIGSHDSIGCGYGEVIVMDSAFLCVSSLAEISFYESNFDSVDKHIFFVSMNPDSGARVGIAPTSNAIDTNAACLPFCDLRSTFPEYGIGNYQYGWFNVGKPFAWLDDIDVICYGADVYVNGLYSLNETKFRFEVCEYNTVSQNCIGITDTIPINDTDNYYGGRLQGEINLTPLYSTYSVGNGFEQGKDYRIKFIIQNDCGLTDEISKVVEIPANVNAEITGDTIICGGIGAITVNGTSSSGDFDSLRWEVWNYLKFSDYDTVSYFANIDTFISYADTTWLDSVTIDTIIRDTFWYNSLDTIPNDSFHFTKYYKEYWDTTITSSTVGSFTFSNQFFHSSRKYFVKLTLFSRCGFNSDSLIIRTKDGPDVSAGPDKYIAYGTPSSPDPELEGSVGGTATSYVWSPSSGLSSTSVLDPTATPSSTTTFVLSATDADGCTNYDSVLVFVNTVANAGRDTTICFSDSIQVGVAAVSGYTYQWSPGNLVSNANIAQPYAYPKAFGTTYLKLQVYSSGNLVGIDDVVIYKDTLDSITFDINPAAMFFDASFGVYHTPVSANNISWNFDDGTGSYTSMGTNFTYSFPNTPSTIYDVCASFANACGTQASCKDCEFDMMGNVIPQPPKPNAVDEPKMENSISVWPNPFTDITVLEYSLTENNNAQIEIIDLNGKVIKTIRINDNSGKVELNLSQQAEGVYQYRFINGNEEIENGKLVLVK